MYQVRTDCINGIKKKTVDLKKKKFFKSTVGEHEVEKNPCKEIQCWLHCGACDAASCSTWSTVLDVWVVNGRFLELAVTTGSSAMEGENQTENYGADRNMNSNQIIYWLGGKFLHLDKLGMEKELCIRMI